MSESNPILSLTNDIPSGKYWCNQVYARPEKPGVLQNGAIEIVTITDPTPWRTYKLPKRIICGNGWTHELEKVVADPNQYWRLVRISDPPKEIFIS